MSGIGHSIGTLKPTIPYAVALSRELTLRKNSQTFLKTVSATDFNLWPNQNEFLQKLSFPKNGSAILGLKKRGQLNPPPSSSTSGTGRKYLSQARSCVRPSWVRCRLFGSIDIPARPNSATVSRSVDLKLYLNSAIG